jgi:hypothetical protein
MEAKAIKKMIKELILQRHGLQTSMLASCLNLMVFYTYLFQYNQIKDHPELVLRIKFVVSDTALIIFIKVKTKIAIGVA